MSDKSGNAFPQTIHNSDGSSVSAFGLTKREWFAGMALQGELANSTEGPWDTAYAQKLASRCFFFADAMLKEGAA